MAYLEKSNMPSVVYRQRTCKSNNVTQKKEYISGFKPEMTWTSDVSKAVTWKSYIQADCFKRQMYNRDPQRYYQYHVAQKEL